MRLLWRFVIAALVGFLVSSLIALASYSLGLWLGRNSDNLLRIIYYSGPFALLLGVTAAAQAIRSVDRMSSLLIAVFAGTALGLVYSYFVAAFLFAGPAFFVVLMLSCWVPGGISAMLVAADGKRLSVMAGIAVLCLSAIFLTEPIFNAFTHNQLLTVAFVTPSQESPTELTAYPETTGFHTSAEIQSAQNEVLERIHAFGYSEDFRVLSLSRQGKGKHSLAILVIRNPITKEVVFPEPDGSTVVYVQQSENWEKKPLEVPTLRRDIEITPLVPAGNGEALFAIPNAFGISLVGKITGKVSDQPR
jgi:hypothetical protein